ncbi:MAG: hypothetical protein U5K51_08140 [Flavobacteriaceae bacterium]|nr:hypothetical protein [Flavobacteriaceae bacterium]
MKNPSLRCLLFWLLYVGKQVLDFPKSLYKLIKKIIKKNPIDPDRIYLTGLSMGGWGAWNLAFAHP